MLKRGTPDGRRSARRFALVAAGAQLRAGRPVGAVEDPGVGLDAGGAIPDANLADEYRLVDIRAGMGRNGTVRDGRRGATTVGDERTRMIGVAPAVAWRCAVSRRKAAERLVWAVETMAVRPTDRLLEIGCGHGVAVSLVCEKLDSGSILAIDRSPTMIAMAEKRNAEYVAAGVASVHAASLDEADLGDALFDKVFAIHVGVFLRGQPTRELEIIKRHLAPGGTFYLVYEPMVADQAGGVVAALSATLEEHGFAVTERLVHDLSASRVTCVAATARRSG